MAISLVAACLGGPSAYGETLNAEERRALLWEAADLVETHYVDKAKGAALAEQMRPLNTQFSFSDPLTFARDVTSTLFSLSSDRHLRLAHDPYLSHALRTPFVSTENTRATTEIPGDFGIPKVEIFQGNIGYVRIDKFVSGAQARSSIDAAFALLASTDSLIVDLRGNQGGAASQVRYLQGYFFEGPTHTMSFLDPGANEPVAVMTEKVVGTPLPNRPLAVLIDEDTASAAEDFAYSTRAFELGTLIGTQSAGAAYTVSRFPVGDEFVLTLSTGMPIHPLTEANWEGEGIVPDIETHGEEAIARARQTLLQRLATDSPDAPNNFQHQWALATANSEITPHTMKPKDLIKLTGTFAIGRVVFDGTHLKLARQGEVTQILLPLADDLFAISGEEDLRLRFDRSRYPLTLERLHFSGRVERFELLAH